MTDTNEQKRRVNGLGKVKKIVAVVSGKGGVGKSTVSVLLARALQKTGQKVGLLDADIYGPSIPLMTGSTRPKGMKGDLILPPMVSGIPVVSAAMFSQGVEAHSLRGPLASQFVRQFFEQVAWGELDTLVVDLPPGTGDIHLTMAQTVRVAAAVVVTTPQDVSLQDVQRSLANLKKVQIPVAALIENMSGILCPKCQKTHSFLPGRAGEILQDQLKLSKHYKLSFVPETAVFADEGKLLSFDAERVSSQTFEALDSLVRESFGLQSSPARASFLNKFKLKWRK